MAAAVPAAAILCAAPAMAGWGLSLAASSSAGAVSAGAPAAPTGVGSACSGLITLTVPIAVTWSPVAHAGTYNVYVSAAGGPYTTAASGLTSTSYNFTPSGLSATTAFTFEVQAVVGTAWSSVLSSPSPVRRVTLALVCS